MNPARSVYKIKEQSIVFQYTSNEYKNSEIKNTVPLTIAQKERIRCKSNNTYRTHTLNTVQGWSHVWLSQILQCRPGPFPWGWGAHPGHRYIFRELPWGSQSWELAIYEIMSMSESTIKKGKKQTKNAIRFYCSNFEWHGTAANTWGGRVA